MNKALFKIFLAVILVVCSFPLTLGDSLYAKDPDYPTQTITFLIPWGAGGTGDLVYRAFADSASKFLGQPIVCINKTGASGTIAATAVANAKPDGYTIGGVSASMVFITPFTPDCPYKNVDGFLFIANLGKYVYPLLVKEDAPWGSWKELLDYVRKHPEGVKVGIAGAKYTVDTGIILSQIEEIEKVKFNYIPFKSSLEILTASLGGHIDLFASSTDANVMSHVKVGKLRMLGFYDAKVPGYEKYPSFTELYPGVVQPSLFGYWGPKGMPDTVVKKLHDATAHVIKDPGFINLMDRLYTPIWYMHGTELQEYIEKTTRATEVVMKKLQAEEEAKPK